MKNNIPEDSGIFDPIHLEYIDDYPLSAVQDAVLATNMLLKRDEFYKRIAALSPLSLATVSSADIASMMRSSGISITVGVYYSICPDKKIDGFDNECNPNEIFINFWTLDRSIASLCNTIIHGCVHAVNALHKNVFFGHGNVLSGSPEATAPYVIGGLAEAMIGGAQPYSLQHDPYEGRIRHIKKCFLQIPQYPF